MARPAVAYGPKPGAGDTPPAIRLACVDHWTHRNGSGAGTPPRCWTFQRRGPGCRDPDQEAPARDVQEGPQDDDAAGHPTVAGDHTSSRDAGDRSGLRG